ncbi:MAG: SH3 domain-containing C40 family peptidase [Lachnospiraceae bacterium]|nr:SH3 domain-containing C40 family peptidase [Lachnospiraceae bacterium]
MRKRKFLLTVSGICLLSCGVGAAFLNRQGQDRMTEVMAQEARAASLLQTSRTDRGRALSPEDYENIAVSQVSDYVNIRQEPNTSSTIVGKIYNNCAANILETVEGEGGSWYRIQSGTVSGYIKAQYFITGAEAEAIAKEIGIEYATINTAALRLRAEPNLTSDTLTMLTQGAEYVVLEEKDNFALLSVDEDMTGYVSMDYIKTRVEFKQAVSLEEEAAKQAEEARIRQEAEDAIQKLEEVKMVEAKKDTSSGASEQTGTPGGDNVQNGGVTISEAQATTAAASTTPAAVANGTIAANPLGDGDDPRVSAPAQAATAAASATIAQSTQAAANAVGPGGASAAGNAGGSGQNSSVSAGTTYGPGGNASTAVVSATRTAIVAYSKQFLGNPYVYGGTSLTSGTDCSGFVMRIYEHFGISTGRSSRDQAANGRTIAIDAVQPGDLLFYASGDYINHVAIYIGGGQIIHAASSKTGIITSPANYRTPYKAATFLD